MRASTSEWIREISVSEASIDVATTEVTDFPLEEGETEAETMIERLSLVIFSLRKRRVRLSP